MDPNDELQPQPMSFEDYLRLDAEHPRPVEYVAGNAYPKYGRSMLHNRITMNIGLALHRRVAETDCHAFMSVMRTQVADDVICYPDVVVTFDETDRDEWTLFRPCLIVEIASSETAEIDSGAKRDAYLGMPSLLAYMIVSESDRLIERHWRALSQDDWQTDFIRHGIVSLPCSNVEMTVEAIYKSLPPIEDK